MGVKVKFAQTEELNQAFRNVFMLIGLRPQYYPNELESLFLYDFVKKEFGNHALNEIVLAFRKAITDGYPGLPEKEVKVYDYFTPAYFATIMRHYRIWASDFANKYADEKYIEHLKSLPPTNVSLPIWREVIEKDYQHLLSGAHLSHTFPEAHYDVLVQDQYIKEDFYLKRVKQIKQELLQELNIKLVALQRASENDEKVNPQYFKVKNLLEEYASGKRENDFVLKAKQSVVFSFFKYNRDRGNKTIYEQKQ